MKLGDKVVNIGEELVDGVANEVEDFIEGTIQFVVPENITDKMNKDYIKSFFIELLPILMFIGYYNYYQC